MMSYLILHMPGAYIKLRLPLFPMGVLGGSSGRTWSKRIARIPPHYLSLHLSSHLSSHVYVNTVVTMVILAISNNRSEISYFSRSACCAPLDSQVLHRSPRAPTYAGCGSTMHTHRPGT